MGIKRVIEIVALGLAGHSGCIVACFGVGMLGLTPECSQMVETGHPLTYLFCQVKHLLVGLFAVWCYGKIPKETYRIPMVLILSALLWVPLVSSYVAFSLQAIFVVQVVGLILGRRLKGYGFPLTSCCDKGDESAKDVRA